MKVKLFEYLYTKGNVDYYKPNPLLDLKIKAIDLETGKIEYKKILEYTIHKDLKMYKVHDLKNRFKDFWVSDDHSLIVFDKFNDKLKKISPIKILENPNQYSLVQDKDNSISYIPCSSLEITYDPNITEAADFTVEDYYTFCTDDGIFVQDTMAIFTPISEEALEDVKKLTNILHSANPRRVMLTFQKDTSAGICLLTREPATNSTFKNFKWWKKVKFNGINTTEGRVAIYNFLPDEAKKHLDFEKYFNKQIDIEFILQKLVELGIKHEDIIDFAYKCEELALNAITDASESIDIRTFEISDQMEKYVKQLEETKDPFKQQEILDLMNRAIQAHLLHTDIAVLLECGAFKKNQLFQLLGSKGLMLSPEGKLVLVKSNFAKGLSPTEFFNASHGARSGIIARTAKTSLTGYLQRKLVYGLASVEMDPNIEFCGTSKQLELEVDNDLAQRIINRYIIHDNKVVLITSENINDFLGKTITMYSPIYCKSKKLCRRCFGEDWKLLKSTYVGNIAAQSIGERLTQEMLKAFHTGGVVKPIILDFYKNVSENTRLKPDFLKKYFTKEGQASYRANMNLRLTFLKEDGYNFNVFVRDMDDKIEIPYVIALCETEDNQKFHILFDGNTLFHSPDNMTYNSEGYTLIYNKGSLIFEVIPEVNDMELITKRIISVVEGRAAVKDEYHLLMKLYREIKPMGNINLVWMEILISQLFRNKDDPKIPARLGKVWNPTLISIKQIPYLESWIRGLEFENFGKAITNALLNDTPAVSSKLDELLV